MRKVIFALFIFSLILLALSFCVFIFFNRSIQTQTFYASVNITEKIAGIDLNKSSLTFGKVHRGGTLTRNIDFYNQYPFPVIVIIDSSGTIKPFLFFEHKVYFKTNETRKIGFSVAPNETASLGIYDGNVTFKIKMA